MWLSGVLIAAAGVLLVVIGRLGATGRLPRNHFAGIRLPSTMASDEAWRTAHVAAAPALVAGGIVAVVLGVVAVVSSVAGGDGLALALVIAAGVAVLAAATVATVLALRAVR